MSDAKASMQKGDNVHQNKMVLTLAFLAGAAAVLSAQAQTAATSANAEWPAVAARMEKAVLAEDAAGVKDARTACLSLLAAGPPADRALLIRYTIAYAGWRLAFNPKATAKEQDDLLADAVTQLNLAIKANDKFAEAYGLLNGVYGAQIGKNFDLGPTLGPAAGELIGRALELEPDNPRLVLMRGLAIFNTPAEFGGSTTEGEALIRRAGQLFDKEPADKPWPNWGRFDVHVWLGQALARRGDNAGARTEYAAALKLAPDSQWVRSVLLPQVSKD
jgi:tetratricopeptide (TPR) repeat protein